MPVQLYKRAEILNTAASGSQGCRKIARAMLYHNVCNDSDWFARAVLALFARQTPTEQTTHTTKDLNGRGFNGTDAKGLSWVAEECKKWLAAEGKPRYPSPLNPRNMEKARKRLSKYSGQLLRIAEGK
jgi:hypothetical protein